LTLPGTVGSYYTQASTADNTVFSSNGFTFEYWVNYASFANTTNPQIGKVSPTDAGFSWRFDSNVNAGVTFTYYNGGFVSAYGGSTQLVTGRWNHCAVQSNGTNIYIFINGVLVSTTAVSGTPATPTAPITIGQQNNATGGNFAIAKARLVYGNDTSAASKAAANVYSSGTFTPNPNFAAVPAGATVAWQLESQYPLPTFPSIQDVTVVPSQLTSYGSIPTPVGGVTSNVLGPFSTTYPQLDSIRFDGTGYIDYGNAASSVLTANLWASPWTIEGWVYINNTTNFHNLVARNTAAGSPYDWSFYVAATTMYPSFIMNSASPVTNTGTTAVAPNTWTHLAVTWDGSKSNIYVGGTLSNSIALSTFTYTPSQNFQIGQNNGFYTQGNLADLRVSNVARYTGSSYTVPNVADGSAPFVTDRNTLLLLKSLGGQVGQTLEVQGRGLGSTSIGAGRTVQSYPPAPMSSYLLDTTGNTAVTYGQGKYVASASSEITGASYTAYQAFDKRIQAAGVAAAGWEWAGGVPYSTSSPYSYTGSVVTVDALGNSYAGEWLQLQMPVSIILSSFTLTASSDSGATQGPANFSILGSRDGINWTRVSSYNASGWGNSTTQTFSSTASQAYNYYRLVVSTLIGGGGSASIMELVLNGTEESL